MKLSSSEWRREQIISISVDRIVLLREVPIIQKPEERIAHEERHIGTHNLIFSYQVAIGTPGTATAPNFRMRGGGCL